MDTFTVYIHRNKINNKLYVGQTKQKITKRWNNGNGYKNCARFWNAIQKYGWHNFEHIIIATDLSQQQANILEEQLISLLHTTNSQYGYNIKFGGDNNTHTLETKQKISVANKKSHQNLKWSLSQRQFVSKLFSGTGNPFYGQHHSQQTRQQISEHRRGKRAGQNHPLYGKHHSSESISKISANRVSKGGKSVRCINTGEIFPTMMDAARWCGLANSSTIGQVCNNTGKQKTAGRHPITHEKLYWEFIDEKTQN